MPDGPAADAAGSVDEVLEQLERTIGRLADPAAPLERLVTDYEGALRLLAAADARLEAAARRIERLGLADS